MAPTYLQVSLRLNSGPHVSGLPEGLVQGRGSAHPSLSMSSTQSLPCHLWQHIQGILIRHVLLQPPEERTMKSLSADPRSWPWGDLRGAIPDLPTTDLALFHKSWSLREE